MPSHACPTPSIWLWYSGETVLLFVFFTFPFIITAPTLNNRDTTKNVIVHSCLSVPLCFLFGNILKFTSHLLVHKAMKLILVLKLSTFDFPSNLGFFCWYKPFLSSPQYSDLIGNLLPLPRVVLPPPSPNEMLLLPLGQMSSSVNVFNMGILPWLLQNKGDMLSPIPLYSK